MKKIVLLLGIGLSILSCTLYNEKQPNDELFKQSVKDFIENNSENKIELVELEKTNGIKEKINDIDGYYIDFLGKIKFKKDGWTKIYESTAYSKGFLLVKEIEPKVSLSNYYEKIKKDDVKEIQGRVFFIKKEKGWERDIADITIKHK